MKIIRTPETITVFIGQTIHTFTKGKHNFHLISELLDQEMDETELAVKLSPLLNTKLMEHFNKGNIEDCVKQVASWLNKDKENMV